MNVINVGISGNQEQKTQNNVRCVNATNLKGGKVKDKKGNIMSISSKQSVRELLEKQKRYKADLSLKEHMPKYIVKHIEKKLKEVTKEIETIGVAL